MQDQRQHAAQSEYAYAQRLVCAYFRMMTVGCSTAGVACSNAHCRSNPNFIALTANDAVVRSIQLATQCPSPLCIPLVHVASPEKVEHEDRPEVNEDDETETISRDATESNVAALTCSPRRRLSSAVELDFVLNLASPGEQRTGVNHYDHDADQRLQGDSDVALRGTSLHKRKLMDALKRGFCGSRCEVNTANKG